MKVFYSVIFFLASFFFYQHVFAQNPAISRNVPVLQNVEANQCSQTWEGRGSPVSVEVLSGGGSAYGTAPGITSCTGCGYDQKSQSCICSICYNYFN